MLGDSANTPSAARQNCTSFGAVQQCQISIFSPKAEADSHLRVGKEALWFFIGSPGGRSRAEMNRTPGLKKETGNKGFNLERIFSITYFGEPQTASRQSQFCYPHSRTGGRHSSGARGPGCPGDG